MHALQQTSLFAFREVQKTLGTRQKAVYDALRTPKTDKEIADCLNLAINEVTPRRNELVKLGMVRKAGVVKQNGRSAISWEIQ